MARTKQIWTFGEFKDHAGRRIRSAWGNRSNGPERASSPELTIQIYSLFAVDNPIEQVSIFSYFSSYSGFLQDWYSWPRFDLYEPMSDLAACVEHQRREIEYRKTADPQTNPGPPIPKHFHNSVFEKRATDGFLIVNTTVRRGMSWVIGPRNGWPVYVYFQRDPHTTQISQSCLLQDMSGEPEDDRPVRYRKEIAEMEFGRRNPEYDLGSELWEFLGYAQSEQGGGGDLNQESSFHDNSREVYDFDVTSKESMMEGLSLLDPTQMPNISDLNSYAGDNHLNLNAQPIPANGSLSEGVLFSNYENGVDPTLRYMVYVGFPMTPDTDLALLGHVFTAAILNHLPPGTTTHFEFFPTPVVTDDSALSKFHRILNDTRTRLDTRPCFTLGGLQTDGTRAYPVNRRPIEFRDRNRVYFRTFSVILDVPNFLNSSGVLFALTDNDLGDGDDGQETCVWRSKDIDAVAHRLRFENGFKYY